MNEKIENNKSRLKKLIPPYFYLITYFLIISLSFLHGLFIRKKINLQKNLEQCLESSSKKVSPTTELTNDPDSLKEKRRELNKNDLNDQIINGGSIKDVLFINTDKWATHTSVLNNGVEFSYKYPEYLYVTSDSNDFSDILYFFESAEASERYMSCINDPTTAPGSVITRNWEGACVFEEDLLFEILVHPKSQGGNNLSQYSLSDIVEYSSPNEKFSWKLPKNENYFIGAIAFVDIICEGTDVAGDYDKGVVVELQYPYIQSMEEKTKNLTKTDYLTLLTHILSTFKREN